MTKPKKPTHGPRPGTFAAWVYEQPLTASPAELARQARVMRAADGKPKWPKATPQAVYNVRWYYGLTRVASNTASNHTPNTAPAVPNTVVAARAAKLAAARATATRSTPPAPPELLTVIGRYGVDAARRAIDFYESRTHVSGVLGGAV